jgi:membrane-associated phospholipid phosphatase
MNREATSPGRPRHARTLCRAGLVGLVLSVAAALSGCGTVHQVDGTVAPTGSAGADPLQSPPEETAETGRAAEETPPDEVVRLEDLDILRGDYLSSYAENSWRILTGPLRYDRDDWLLAGLITAGTGAFLALDEEIDDFWQDELKGNVSDTLADVTRQFGETDVLFIATLGGYALAEALGLEREKSAFLLTLESVILSGALTGGFKLLTGRRRPSGADGAFDWEGPLGGGGIDSAFPSGHTAKAFGAASVIAEIYGDEYPWVPWLAYAAAAGTGLSRINDEKHWASDVFLGGAFGILVGKMVTRYSPFMRENNLTVRPFESLGLAISWRW